MQDLETIINYPHSLDLYRYIWDGMQSLSGLNPYDVVPGVSGTGEIYRLMEPNFLSVMTPYPPVAQWLFVMLAGIYHLGGLGLVKLAGIIPLLLIGILVWRRVNWWGRLILLAHPFVWIHGIRDGHIDMWVGLFSLVAVKLIAKKRLFLGILFLTLGIFVKPYVVVWLPLVGVYIWRRFGVVKLVHVSLTAVMVAGLAYLPYRYDLNRYGDFVVMMQEWNPSPQRFWQMELGLSRELSQLAGIGILGIGIGFLMLRKKLDWTGLSLAGMLYLVTAPVVFPWYSLWLVVPAVLSGRWWVIGILGMIQWRIGVIV